MKAHLVEHTLFIFCPGCNKVHAVNINDSEDQTKVCWKWNKSLEKPTLSPSLLVKRWDGVVCHSFVKDGMIHFLNDCTHELRGKTVELPDYPENLK